MELILELEKENLGGAQIRDICEKLQKDEIKALTVRECVLTDKDYKRILKWVGGSKNLRHLSLSIGMIPDTFRVHVLAQALQKNKSLTGLFIHGNQIGEAGVKILHPPLLKHRRILSLDVGDCGIGDEGLELICQLLVKRHNHPGLEELVLSSNPEITTKGWAKLGMAISAGCSLRSLYVDYNDLGDSSASCLLVAVAGTKSLETLDMECVGATETSGQVLLHLVQNYSVSITNINLEENEIAQATLESIRMHMPGLMEDELSNGIHSDEEHSLATSEPPLDPNCDLEEFASPANFITIVGATDSPVYTPDGIVIDRSIGTSEETAVVDEGNDAIEDILNDTKIQNQNQLERGLSDDAAMHVAVSVNEAQTILDLEPGLSEETYIRDTEMDAHEKGESEKQVESEKTSLTQTEASKKGPSKRRKTGTIGSLADRIKSQRDKSDTSNLVTVIPTAETEEGDIALPIKDELDEKTNTDDIFLVRSKESVDEQSDKFKAVEVLETVLPKVESVEVLETALPKIESMEEVEDIEELDENAINKAHDSLIIPGTPSKMSLCSGPGVKSTSSIFDDDNLLRISPSNSMNKHRRFSHNIEIKDNEKQDLQGIAKHRGSEGNISARFSNRRGSVPYNARLTVHGVGSTTDLNELQSFDARRRLSSASTLGDVA